MKAFFGILNILIGIEVCYAVVTSLLGHPFECNKASLFACGLGTIAFGLKDGFGGAA